MCVCVCVCVFFFGLSNIHSQVMTLLIAKHFCDYKILYTINDIYLFLSKAMEIESQSLGSIPDSIGNLFHKDINLILDKKQQYKTKPESLSDRYKLISIANFFASKGYNNYRKERIARFQRWIKKDFYPYFDATQNKSFNPENLYSWNVKDIIKQMPEWQKIDSQIRKHCIIHFKFELFSLQFIHYLKFVRHILFLSFFFVNVSFFFHFIVLYWFEIYFSNFVTACMQTQI